MESPDSQPHERLSADYEYVYPIRYTNLSACGYCGASRKAYAYHALSSSISTEFYLVLLDRGWRRSGVLLYRPDQKNSCCPHYTTRLNSELYKPSRDQRQTINRFNKFVVGEAYSKEAARRYPRSKEESKKRDNEFQLVERIHEAEYHRLKTPPEPSHKLEVTLENNDFTEEKYRVWENYQHIIHKDDPEEISRTSFKRFLCTSPLRSETIVSADGHKKRLGSYHQCYRLDGKLVALGVIDLLPQSVSSVYFLYDESIHKFSPGKLSALREIALATEEGYRWWYPGYYIHSCPKMRYKLDYRPQEVLDPVSLQWNPLDDEILRLLDEKPFVSLFLEKNHSKEASHSSDASKRQSTSKSDDDKLRDEVGDEMEDEDEEMNEKHDMAWIFTSGMPGIPSIYEMAQLNLDNIMLKLPDESFFQASDLVGWRESRIDEWPSVKAGIAQLVAVIGPDLMDRICVDLSRKL